MGSFRATTQRSPRVLRRLNLGTKRRRWRALSFVRHLLGCIIIRRQAPSLLWSRGKRCMEKCHVLSQRQAGWFCKEDRGDLSLCGHRSLWAGKKTLYRHRSMSPVRAVTSSCLLGTSCDYLSTPHPCHIVLTQAIDPTTINTSTSKCASVIKVKTAR